ncbi:hypothetical protein [Mycobacteroides sp. LB1]|uniref:hypothetical protein n=1 Tax=Mycobacteroides sp. LB1 TaxID=2750814 RepID=UPI0015DDCB7C|nr:hypothetical protein [Mycobacteroides sp. LB1]
MERGEGAGLEPRTAAAGDHGTWAAVAAFALGEEVGDPAAGVECRVVVPVADADG